VLFLSLSGSLVTVLWILVICKYSIFRGKAKVNELSNNKSLVSQQVLQYSGTRNSEGMFAVE
jgi:hypothetical protein